MYHDINPSREYQYGASRGPGHFQIIIVKAVGWCFSIANEPYQVRDVQNGGKPVVETEESIEHNEDFGYQRVSLAKFRSFNFDHFFLFGVEFMRFCAIGEYFEYEE